MISEISPQQLKDKLDAKEPLVLVDCREDDEFRFCHLKNSVLLPVANICALAEKTLKKDDQIIVYCHHGLRSQLARKQLIKLGYKNVVSLRGGIDAWSLQVDSKIARY